MSSESSYLGLLQGIEFDDPRLYQALQLLGIDFYALLNELHPPSASSVVDVTATAIPGTITNFVATLFENNLRLTWNSSGTTFTYEIRYKSGVAIASDWATASSILRTGTTSADINPLTIPMIFGNHSFLIKAISSSGIESATAAIVTVNIPVISAPTITATVISNSVLLSWTTPISVWKIDHYNVYKNGTLQGTVSGTFEVIFEIIGGTYSYTVEAVDIVGNVGTPSPAVVVIVGDPSDFVLFDTLTSTFSGTKIKCKQESIGGINYLLACVNITETFQQHFVNHGWATPQDQINAGYPIYIQPAETTGSYQEVFDFGVVVPNIIIAMNWNQITVTGTVSVSTSTLEYSSDGISYSTPAMGTSVFAAAVRFVRFTMNFVGNNDKALAYFTNLRCLLNVHRELDGGSGTASATDATGTTFLFNKAFRSVESITVTPISTTACFPVVNFISVLNPVSFKVLLYDNAGVRVTKTVQWIARGIIG